MSTLDQPAHRDYRDSHVEKGADYDQNLAQRGFDTYMAVRERAIVTAIVRQRFAGGIPRYLDFACGTGRVTQFAEQLADMSYGVDVAAKMLAEARRKCQRTTFFHVDITREELPIAPVNLISAFRFFANAQHELRLEAIRAIRSLLVDGGYLVLNNHKNARSIRRLVHSCVGKSGSPGLHYDRLSELLTQNGFKIRRVHGIGLWIVRDRFSQPRILKSPVARSLEILSSLPGLARYCPDYVVVAQKVS